MDQEKIGKLINTLRKEKKWTQKELADLIGVSDKSVSKWERGVCLPDVSLFKALCETLGITLNEFFAGEKIKEENYKEKADENLLQALENSTFTLKERQKYFKEKWQREHFVELMLTMFVIVFFIIYGWIKDSSITVIFIIIGFVSGIVENNRMMAYIEKNAFGKNEKQQIEKEKKES